MCQQNFIIRRFLVSMRYKLLLLSRKTKKGVANYKSYN